MGLIFSRIGKVEQIHTHEGPSDKFLFLYKAFSVKSTHLLPPLFHQEDSTEKYQFSNYSGNIYLQLCVVLFHFSFSWFSEMQFGMIYIETWGSTQRMLHSWQLYFVLVSLFLAEHIQCQLFYTAWASVYCVLSHVFLVGLWMGLVFFVLLGPSPMSVWIGSVIVLNYKKWAW